jgi:protein-S-isoprenylcysteine O-methyltransferase Ste14
MPILALKIPPVAVLLITLLMAFALCYVPLGSLYFHAPNLLPWVVAVVGVFIAIAGVWEFRRASTTVNPTTPDKASQLVSGGIYRFTRNPMYLGMALVLVAWIVKLGCVWSMLALPVFVWYLNVFQITPEEKAMEKLFGESYRDYLLRVRRWL